MPQITSGGPLLRTISSVQFSRNVQIILQYRFCSVRQKTNKDMIYFGVWVEVQFKYIICCGFGMIVDKFEFCKMVSEGLIHFMNMG